MTDTSPNPDPCLLSMLFAFGRFLYHVSPALLAVIGGGIIVNRFFVRRANQARLIEFLCEDIRSLLKDCADYWSVGYAKDKKSEQAVLEARIKGAILRLNGDLIVLCTKYKMSALDQTPLVMELHDQCTGGDFESSGRKADTARYLKIVNTSKQIVARLRDHIL